MFTLSSDFASLSAVLAPGAQLEDAFGHGNAALIHEERKEPSDAKVHDCRPIDANGMPDLPDSVATVEFVPAPKQEADSHSYTRAASAPPKYYAHLLDSRRTRYWTRDRKFVQMFIWALTRRIEKSPSCEIKSILSQLRAQLMSDPFNVRNLQAARVLRAANPLASHANKVLQQAARDLGVFKNKLDAENRHAEFLVECMAPAVLECATPSEPFVDLDAPKASLQNALHSVLRQIDYVAGEFTTYILRALQVATYQCTS